MDLRLWLGSAALFAGSLVLVLLVRAQAPPPVGKSAALELRATDLGDRLRVEWNPLRDAVQNATGGTLEVNDGGHTARYPVDAKVLRSGKLDYLRHGDDLLLSLNVGDPGKPQAVGIVRALRADTQPEVMAEQSAKPYAAPQTGQRARRPERLHARRRR